MKSVSLNKKVKAAWCFLLPLSLLISLPFSEAENGVYRPMPMGNLRRFMVKVDNSTAVKTQGDSKEKSKLYEGVDFTQTDISAPWLDDYIRWHHKVRSDPTEIENQKFLVVEKGRGGLESNLKHIPYYLWLASKHKRILLLSNWEVSSSHMCGIQDFLHPNLIDWTLPSSEFLDSAVDIVSDSENHFYNTFIENGFMNRNKDEKILLVRGTQLSYILGPDRVLIDSNLDRKIFKSIFKSLFRLAEPIQQIVDDTKKDNGLVDNDYIGLHVRLPEVYGQLYRTYFNGPFLEDPRAYDTIEGKLAEVGENALRKTKHFLKDTDIPIYVAGDTVESMNLWTQQNDNIVYFEDGYIFAHNNEGECTRFYPELVDLWILSDAKCISFGNEDYGALATMMSGFECWSTYERNAMIVSMGPQSPFFYRPKIPGHVATPQDNSLLKTS